MTATPAQTPDITRASTLELFLDLVFVFTVTQLTNLVAKAQGADYLKAALVFMTLWWIYSGYVWLTSNVQTSRAPVRLLMFAGMAGFLLMALAIPQVFSSGGLMYGLGLLLVTLVHAGLFKTAGNASARAILGIAPFNLVAAGLVLVAGLVRGPLDWVLWTAAVGALILSTLLRREQGFDVSPSHFVERHGLVVIVALGESVIAIGIGARDVDIGPTLALSAVLGLAQAAALWWSYFDADDVRAEHRMETMAPGERVRAALLTFGYGHFVMLCGIIVLAAGIKGVVAHPLGHATAADAWHLGGGLALYLAGDALYRRLLGIAPGRYRLAAGLAALLTVPLGLAAGGLAQLAACVALSVGLLVLEQRGGR